MMQIKRLTKKIGEEVWWVLKRDSLILAVILLIVVKYGHSVPNQSLIDFLNKGCLQYIILIPMPILTIIILSYICTQGEKRLKQPTERRMVQTLYASGTIAVLVAHVATIYVSFIMVFHGTVIPYNEKLDFWHSVDIVYALGIVPFLDWYIFRIVIPKKFSDEKHDRKEPWYCPILHIPQKNPIPSTLAFLIMVVLLEILC